MSDFVRGQKIICVNPGDNDALDLHGVYTFEREGYLGDDFVKLLEIEHQEFFMDRFEDYETWKLHQKKASINLGKIFDEALSMEVVELRLDKEIVATINKKADTMGIIPVALMRSVLETFALKEDV